MIPTFLSPQISPLGACVPRVFLDRVLVRVPLAVSYAPTTPGIEPGIVAWHGGMMACTGFSSSIKSGTQAKLIFLFQIFDLPFLAPLSPHGEGIFCGGKACQQSVSHWKAESRRCSFRPDPKVAL